MSMEQAAQPFAAIYLQCGVARDSHWHGGR